MIQLGWLSFLALILGCLLLSYCFLRLLWNTQTKTLQQQAEHWKATFHSLEKSYAKLATHSNNLQGEKEAWLQERKALLTEIDGVKIQIHQLAKDKAFVLSEIQQLEDVDQKIEQWQKRFALLKKKSDLLTKEKEKVEKMMAQQQKTIVQLQRKLQARRKAIDIEAMDYQHSSKAQPLDGLSSLLNFRKPGNASSDNKDNLTRIKGISSYIEAQLHQLGVYRFDQIANFNKKDIIEITKCIPLAPDQIEKERWIEQAQKFK